MERFAREITSKGWILRSGCAPGADSAFEEGAEHVELFLPWPGFEGRADSQLGTGLNAPAPWTFPIAAQFHPAWGRLSQGKRRLHARNVHQVLGPTESSQKSKCVVCWTEDGEASGGTGQALRIAAAHGIPTFNLQRPLDRERITLWLRMAEEVTV